MSPLNVIVGTPKKVVVAGHGNAKHSLPFYPTDRSLLDELNARAKKSKATELYNEVRVHY